MPIDGSAPASVYRLQMSQKHSLKKISALIPYFESLGIDGIYLSPIFVYADNPYAALDPNTIDPRIGNRKDFLELCDGLASKGMKVIIDLVPNHMSLKNNPWFNDVLEKGQASEFASFFSVRWSELSGRVLLPILLHSLKEELETQKLHLVKTKRSICLRYNDFILPLREETISEASSLFEAIESGNQEPYVLGELLQKQHYKLAHFHDCIDEINYRRFFNINDLIGVEINRPSVLMAHHRKAFDLLSKQKVFGARIDHIDGLKYPAEYLKKIKEHAELVWVEKILTPGEKLSQNWPVEGSVGYDFIHVLNGLFVPKEKQELMTHLYREFTGESVEFCQVAYESKKAFIQHQMYAECMGLSEQLLTLYPDLGQSSSHVLLALVEFIAHLQVYRTYIEEGFRVEDQRVIEEAIIQAKNTCPVVDSKLFDKIESLLLTKKPREDELEWITRLEQVSATSMAKGLEDSAFFRYVRLISLNEVGGDPGQFGGDIQTFHHFNQYKLKHYPLGALASSTHDTKLSEEARMKVNMLCHASDAWKAFLDFREKPLPIDANTAYYLYQVLVAASPASFERIWVCMKKAVREMGLHTSWHTPCYEYEQKVKAYAQQCVKIKITETLEKAVESLALRASHSALILKLGSCGIFDLYQGNETRIFQLVDPDNRSYCLEDPAPRDLKYKLSQIGLSFRKKHKALFLYGKYSPIYVSESVVAFVREYENKVLLVSAKIRFDKVELNNPLDIGDLPALYDIFTGEAFHPKKAFLDSDYGMYYGERS